MKKLIGRILEDFSILEDVNASEVDDFQNPIHIIRLKEVMASYGIQDEVINPIIRTITEQDDKGGLSDKEKEKAKKMGLVSLGYGNWGKEKGGETTHKTVDGKLVAIGDEQPEKDDSGNLEPDDLDPVKTNYMGIGKDDETDGKMGDSKNKKVEAVTKKIYGENGDGPLLQNSKTTEQALEFGYVKGSDWVAPGNAGSNFNENMSNEGALILEQEDLSEDELTEILFNRVKDTKLGGQQKKTSIQSPHNKDTGNVPSNLSQKEKDLYRSCIIAARSAKEKNSRAKRGQDAVGMTNAKIQTFGGTVSDLNNLKEEVNKAEKILVLDEETDKVVEIPKEVMIDWIDSSGGGENAADTAVISVDKDGNLLYDGWSDKKNFSDIQGNSTLNDDYTKQDKNIDNLLENGRIDESTSQQAKDIVKDAQVRSKEIEDNYKKAPLKEAQFFSTYQGEDKERIIQHLKDQEQKYIDNKTTNHVENLISSYGVNTHEELLDKLLEEAENGNPNAKKLKVINRVADSERAHLKEKDGEIPAGLDTKIILSNARDEALNLQRDTVDKLNDLTAKSKNGKEKRLGDLLGFQETIDFLHLDKIETPKNDNDIKAYLKRNTHLCMAGVNVPPKSLKECMNVNNLSEAEDNFEVVTDERIMKDRGTGKYTTGKVVYIYAINKNNDRTFVGEKVFRSREGATGKTNNEIKWSKEMQECFDRKRNK